MSKFPVSLPQGEQLTGLAVNFSFFFFPRGIRYGTRIFALSRFGSSLFFSPLTLFRGAHLIPMVLADLPLPLTFVLVKDSVFSGGFRPPCLDPSFLTLFG